jgi:RNA polymerase sigma-70 factor, ECF subfamily
MQEVSPIGGKPSASLDIPPDADDTSFLLAAQGGNIAAFEVLIRRYDRKIFRIAHHITNNREDAEDVVQEAFLSAFQGLAQFRGDAQFSTWLTRIGVNKALVKLRKRRTIREVSIDEDFEAEGEIAPVQIADWVPNPEELYNKSELRDILDLGLRALNPALAKVFVLRDMEGFSTQQTGEILGLTNQAVKTRLFRARLHLREKLTEYFRPRKSG